MPLTRITGAAAPRKRVRIEDVALLEPDLVDTDDPGDDWFAATRALVTDSFLAAIEATHVVPTTPEYD